LVIAFGTVLAIKLYELTRFLHFVIRHVEALSKQAHKCTIAPHISYFFGDALGILGPETGPFEIASILGPAVGPFE
jgi:hypothetical protein